MVRNFRGMFANGLDRFRDTGCFWGGRDGHHLECSEKPDYFGLVNRRGIGKFKKKSQTKLSKGA